LKQVIVNSFGLHLQSKTLSSRVVRYDFSYFQVVRSDGVLVLVHECG
jgi:hypothetical protein